MLYEVITIHSCGSRTGAHRRQGPGLISGRKRVITSYSIHYTKLYDFGFLGIQFGFGLQNANVSRIFETLGASIDQIPILWIAAPLTGLLIQPIVGFYSDKTWCRLGRRRPYFLAGAILSSLALLVMPNSPYLWVAAGMLWILDASINISMEPFRALVADNLPSRQRTAGFAVQTFFIGIGSVVASAMPYILTNWFDIANVITSYSIHYTKLYERSRAEPHS